MQSLLQQQQQHTLALMLPQPDLPVFTGDPIDYCSFVRAFESLIESRTNSNSSRLYYLVQYTGGDVQELMRSCLTMSHDEGYKEARRLLKERYGKGYKIATAYVEGITSGPPIRSEKAEDLRKFSVLITSCKNALKDLGYLSRINNPDTLQKIIARLPFDMRRKWRDITDDISENKKREITIEDIALFVEKKARSASHPIFGDISASKVPEGRLQKPGQRKGVTSGKSSSFGITTAQKDVKEKSDKQESSRNRLKCPLCKSNH